MDKIPWKWMECKCPYCGIVLRSRSDRIGIEGICVCGHSYRNNTNIGPSDWIRGIFDDSHLHSIKELAWVGSNFSNFSNNSDQKLDQFLVKLEQLLSDSDWSLDSQCTGYDGETEIFVVEKQGKKTVSIDTAMMITITGENHGL